MISYGADKLKFTNGQTDWQTQATKIHLQPERPRGKNGKIFLYFPKNIQHDISTLCSVFLISDIDVSHLFLLCAPLVTRLSYYVHLAVQDILYKARSSFLMHVCCMYLLYTCVLSTCLSVVPMWLTSCCVVRSALAVVSALRVVLVRHGWRWLSFCCRALMCVASVGAASHARSAWPSMTARCTSVSGTPVLSVGASLVATMWWSVI